MWRRFGPSRGASPPGGARPPVEDGRTEHGPWPVAAWRRKRSILVCAAIAAGFTIACVWLVGIDARSAAAAGTGAKPFGAGSRAPSERLSLAWRDSAGQIHAAMIEKIKFETYLGAQTAAIAEQRDKARTAAAAKLAAEMTPI